MAVATTTAIALAAMAAKAGTDIYSAKKQGDAMKKATQLSPQGTQARDQMVEQAGSLNQIGSNFLGKGEQALQGVEGYYSPLLRGDRAAIDQSLSPEIAGITDVYRGANKNLDRSGIRGPQRDVASAELNRDRAGQLALLRPQARAGAAAGMAGLGTNYLGTGLDATKSAGSLLAGVYGGERGSADSAYASSVGYMNDASKASQRGYAGLIFNLLDMYGNRSKTAPIATTGWKPPVAPYPTAPPMNRP